MCFWYPLRRVAILLSLLVTFRNDAKSMDHNKCTRLGHNHSTTGKQLPQLMNLLRDLQTPFLLPQVSFLPAFSGELFLLLVGTAAGGDRVGCIVFFSFGGGVTWTDQAQHLSNTTTSLKKYYLRPFNNSPACPLSIKLSRPATAASAAS